jgi:hypothetical protein
MPGLVPGIRVVDVTGVDGRDEPGHDGEGRPMVDVANES